MTISSYAASSRWPGNAAITSGSLYLYAIGLLHSRPRAFAICFSTLGSFTAFVVDQNCAFQLH